MGPTTMKRIEARTIGAVMLAGLLVGCGGSKTTPVVPLPSSPVGLPDPASAGPVNTYSGAQSPGAWSLQLDHTQNSFSYTALTYPQSPATTAGALSSVNGFSQLTGSGYALEVEGRAAILRPGNINVPPVFAVPQTGCPVITGRIRFQYIGMQTAPDGAVGSAGPTLGYGSVVASTDTAGKAWQFQDLQGNIVAGPGAFSGSCGSANGSAAITLSGPTLLNNLWSPDDNVESAASSTTQSNVWVGPTGFFAADQSDPAAGTSAGASVAGVVEPSSALSTADLASQHYLGFLYEPATVPYGGVNPSAPITSPIAFGQAAGSGTMMTGGIFPGDDVTMTPNSDTIVNLGKEDATLHGLYTGVTITVLDPAQNCANYTGSGEKATSAINDQGFFTCTFAAVAIAGNPEGKYALFITSYNWAVQLGGAPMQIYLFQH